MNQNREKVLEMLDEGKINVEEAENLLSTLEGTESNVTKLTEKDSSKASLLKILVVENGEEKVNISVPLKLVKMLKNIVPEKARDKLDEEGIKLNELIDEIEKGSFDGKLVAINDGEDRIEIKLGE